MTLMKLIDTYSDLFAEAEFMRDQGTHNQMAYEFPELQDRCSKARAAVVEAVEKLERDAARYRWLRDKSDTVYLEEGPDIYGWFPSDSEDIDAAADAAIDAAMEK